MIGKKYEIYVGLKDQDKYEEIFDIDSFSKVLAKLCYRRQMGFSLVNQFGGYSHNKGYTTETSLKITLIGVDENIVNELSATLKELINTDTILITSEDVEYEFK